MGRFVEVAKRSRIPEHGVISVEVEDPATEDVTTYNVRVIGDAVEIEI